MNGQLSRRLPSLFDELSTMFDRAVGDGPASAASGFAPLINVAETENAYEISLDLPGLKPEEFHVELKDGQLWITGERKNEKEQKGRNWHRVEKSYGSFRRVVTLGSNVDPEHVDASYKDGVLAVVVPKAPEARARKIEVKM